MWGTQTPEQAEHRDHTHSFHTGVKSENPNSEGTMNVSRSHVPQMHGTRITEAEVGESGGSPHPDSWGAPGTWIRGCS